MRTTELTQAQRDARSKQAATAIRDRLALTWKMWRRPWRTPDFGLATDLVMDALGDLAAEILVDGTMMRALTVKDGVVTLEFEQATELVKAFVGASRGIFNEYGAENYVEMHMDVVPEEQTTLSLDVRDGDNPTEAYTLTVQRRLGMTPHAFRRQAEQQRDDTLRIVAEWCVQAVNGPEDAEARETATDLMFRLEQAGHTLPEVIWP